MPPVAAYDAVVAARPFVVVMTGRKLRRLAELRRGHSLKESAKMAGVSHVTAIKWLRSLPAGLS